MNTTWIMSFIIQIIIFFVITTNFVKTTDIEGNFISEFRTFNIESLCNGTNESEVFLHSWSAANFQLGVIKDDSKRKRIHKCKVKILTDKTFGLAAAIEEVDVGGKKAGSSSKCSDYIQFVSYGQSFLQQVFGKLDIGLLSHANSDKLCGKRSLKGPLSSAKSILTLSTEANSFYSLSNTMFLIFHQRQSEPLFNNSFSVIVTSFGQGHHAGSCEGMFKCRSDNTICIHPNFTCDGHVNCAMPKSGSDELICESGEEESYYNPIAVAMIVLSGLVAVLLGMCILITIICQLRKKPLPGTREEHRQRRREELRAARSVGNSSAVSDVPRYESVILSDCEAAKSCDLPPSYDTLFPQECSDNKQT